ncbi:sensor of ECF-type sigma factor [Aequorivita echinoideorum]|nr:sensor of ECF-type sigma factor [Aequorivita echinoideorum]
MKNILLLYLFLSSTFLIAQNKHEKIQAFKAAFITERMGFTPAEAEKFWPIYNVYEEKFHDLRKKNKDILLKLKKGTDALTDAEANDLIDKDLNLNSERATLEMKRVAALRKVLNPKKIIVLKKVEEDFKKELLEHFKRGKFKNED